VSQMSPGHLLQFHEFLPFHATVVVSWALGWVTQCNNPVQAVVI
jgi:hypothetical protein